VVARGYSIGGTYSGCLDATDCDVTLLPGQSVVVTWEDGDPGATAVATVTGDRTVPG
jgi:hypothetical protein